MPKAESSVHNSVTSSIRFDLPEGASDYDRKIAAKIAARCVETTPPNDPLARPVVGMCWTWTGYVSASGYGTASIHSKTTSVHRWALSLVSDVTGMHADHLCRNKLCCNQSHLEPVTNRENTVRGTTYRGNAPRRCNRCSSVNGYIYHSNNRGNTCLRWVCRPCNAANQRRVYRRRLEREAAKLAGEG